MAQDASTGPQHVYEPLADAENQIRLVRSSRHDEDHVRQATQRGLMPHRQLELQTFHLVKAPTYNAISYTWGSTHQRKININGTLRDVRVNCLEALQQAYEYDSDSWYWIDSICINQNVVEEKAKQVGIMWNIYQTASCVLACVGPAENDSKLMAEMAAVIDKKADFFDDASDWLPWLVDLGERRVAALCSAYEAFSNRSYWSRLWIVQELSAAQSVWVLCGEDSISWQALEVMSDLLHDVNKLLPEKLHWPAVGTARNTPLEAVILFDQDTPLDVGHIFTNFGDFKCADLRDRLYGLLHIVKWPDESRPILPDYSKTVFDLGLETSTMLELFRIEDMLAAFEIDSSHPQMLSLIQRRKAGPPGRGETNGDVNSMKVVSKVLFDHFSTNATGQVLSPSDMKTVCARITEDTKGYLTAPLHRTLDSGLTSYTGEFQPFPSRSVPNQVAAACRDGNFKQIVCEDQVVALTCSDTMANDILVHAGQEYQGILLVLRQVSPGRIDVIGQGVTGNVFDLGSDEVFHAHVEVSMTAEDILLLVGQDVLGKRRPLDLSLRRLNTRPLMFPEGAVKIDMLED